MSSILAGSFSKNGPFTSLSEIVYSAITGSWLVPTSAVQISGVSALSEGKPLASAKALRAFCAFSPSLPSISPGENWARSSRTWAFTTAGSALSSAAGFERSSALLMAAASMPAAVAGSTSHPKKMVATNKRIIRQPPADMTTINFGLASSAAGSARRVFQSLRRPLHRRLLDRFLGVAEVLGGIDQCDMRQRLRKIPGLTCHTGIELLRQQAQIVRDRDHAFEQRLRLGDIAGQHMGVGEPEGAGKKRAFDRLRFMRDLAGIVPQHKSIPHHVFLNSGDSAANARIRGGKETDRGHQQYTGIEQLRAIGFDKGVLRRVKALLADVAADGVAQAPPAIERCLESELFGALDAAVERDPCHQFRRDIMLARTAPLPDAVIRLIPYFRQVLQHRAFQCP